MSTQQEWYHNEYLQSDHWKQKRAERIKYDNSQCVFCGKTTDLNVHHLTYESIGNECIEHDLVTLCRDCHERFHKFLDEHQDDIRAINRKWMDDAKEALKEVTEKYRVISGEYLANVMYEFVGKKPIPNMARFVSVFEDGLQLKAGYGSVWVPSIGTFTYNVAVKKFAQKRRKK